MPTMRQLQLLYKKLFPGMRIRIVRKRRVRRVRSATATAHYLKHKEAARALITERLTALNLHYGFTYHSVTIRDQRSRWGSCSKKGNLNFNYRLVFLPQPLVDAVIAHELCHLKEFNHSKRFWALVAETIPDYKERKLALAKVPLHTLGKGQAQTAALL